jgi:hypothetical protein
MRMSAIGHNSGKDMAACGWLLGQECGDSLHQLFDSYTPASLVVLSTRQPAGSSVHFQNRWTVIWI